MQPRAAVKSSLRSGRRRRRGRSLLLLGCVFLRRVGGRLLGGVGRRFLSRRFLGRGGRLGRCFLRRGGRRRFSLVGARAEKRGDRQTGDGIDE